MNDLASKWADALPAGEQAGPGWLRELRAGAAARFRANGLPHRKVEAWKYVPVRVFENFQLGAAAAAANYEAPSALCEQAVCFDLVDGVPAPVRAERPAGLTVLPLADGIEQFAERLQPLFEAVETDGATRAFAALNTALARDGLVLHVAAGVDAGRVLLRWVGSGAASDRLVPSRLFVLLEEGARLDLVEQFEGVGEAGSGLNVLCQAELAAAARLEHTRVQNQSAQAVLLTSMTVTQAADSRYVYRGFDLGARLARHELAVLLQGPGAEADLAGAYVLDGQRFVDNHVNVEHRAPGCRSEQLFRGVLGGRSRGVFNGRALIQPGADGSSVRQSNANLLLSPLAEMDTKPELEIYADEVEASHGATVGQLDETAVFYLRSRGLSEAAARRLLTAAFCRAVTDRVSGRGLAERIAERVDAAMPESEA